IRPRGGGPKGRRRVVIDQGGGRPGQGQRARPGDRPADRGPRQPREVVAPTGPVTVESGVTLRDFSQALGVAMPQIIKLLMALNTMKTATQSLTDEEVQLIAAELEREVTIKHADDDDVEPESFEDAEETLEARPPVVTIMGHVDHGKTTLLDAIRKTSVVSTEAGGITQHIGAYQADHDGRRITFLDTPGHEAFTAMRARGAKVTDIAVLVVAADDGVMPQTKESISHARAAEVPIVVAVNKIDVPDADPNRVRSELSTEGLQPEEWGGTTQFSDVSAKQAENLDDLLEKVLLVADAELELTANPKADASGPIIESRLDVGRGPVARGSAASSSRRHRAACRSSGCSSRCRPARCATSTSSSRATSSARSRRRCQSWARSSTRRCASTSSTRASAGSPRTTSCSPPPPARRWSASTSVPTPRRVPSRSARASRSAPTA